MKREEVKEVLEKYEKWISDIKNVETVFFGDIKQLKEKFLNENYPEPLEVGKWYKDTTKNSKLLFKIEAIDECRGEGGTIKAFGFGFSSGDWHNSKWWYSSFENATKELVLATKEEVDEALLNYARKKGYKNGNYKCLRIPELTNKVDESDFHIDEEGCVWHGNERGLYNLVFDAKTGKWAEIIETKVIEVTLDEIAKKFGVDAVKVKK